MNRMTNGTAGHVAHASWTIVALAAVNLAIAAIPLQAQTGPAKTQLVMKRLGLSESSLAGISLERVDFVCSQTGQGSTCDLRYPTSSDETCRALAVQFAMQKRSDQLADGGKPGVVARATCAAGVVAVFSAGSRRAVMGHRDAAGNTGQREIPL